MNSEHVVFLEGGIISSRGQHQSFQSGRRNPLPFLFQPRPVAAGLICRPRRADNTRDPVPRPTGWASKVEALGVRIVAGMFVAVLLCTGFGAQHITYVRAKNQLGRDLRQREQDLKAVTFAYRALETRKAIELAQTAPTVSPNIGQKIIAPAKPPTSVARAASLPAGRKVATASATRTSPNARQQLAKVVKTSGGTRVTPSHTIQRRQQASNSRSRAASSALRS